MEMVAMILEFISAMTKLSVFFPVIPIVKRDYP